jgi:hypothetical protein
MPPEPANAQTEAPPRYKPEFCNTIPPTAGGIPDISQPPLRANRQHLGRLLDDFVKERGLSGCSAALGTATFSSQVNLPAGVRETARHAMNPLSTGDVFLTVAIMSATFLAEVVVFILLGIF